MISCYTNSNLQPILSVWERSVKHTHHFLKEDDFNRLKDILPSIMKQVTLYTFTVENQVAGFLGVSTEEIEMLFVDPLYIGKGVGKALLFFALTQLKLTQVSVNEENTKALDFYKHFGFNIANRSLTDGFGFKYPILHLKKE